MPAIETDRLYNEEFEFWTYTVTYGFEQTGSPAVTYGTYDWVDRVGGMTAFHNDTHYGNFTNVTNIAHSPILFLPMIETTGGDKLYPPLYHPQGYASIEAISPSDDTAHPNGDWQDNNWMGLNNEAGDFGALRTRFIIQAQTYMVDEGFEGIGMGGAKVEGDYDPWDHSVNFEQTWYMHPDGTFWVKVTITNEDNDHFNLSSQGGVIRFVLNPVNLPAINKVAYSAGNGAQLTDGDAMAGGTWWGFYGTDVGPGAGNIYDHNLAMAYHPSPDTLAATAIKYTDEEPWTACSGVEFTYASPILTTGTSRTFYFRGVAGWQGNNLYGNSTTEAPFKTRGYQASKDYVVIDDFPASPGANDGYFWTNGGELDPNELGDDYIGAGTAGTDSQTEDSGDYNLIPGSLSINKNDPSYSKVALDQVIMLVHPNRGGGTAYTYTSPGLRLRGIADGKRFMVAVNATEDPATPGFNLDWELYHNHKIRYFNDDVDNYYEWNIAGYFAVPAHVYILEDGNFEPVVTSLTSAKDTENPSYIKIDFSLHDIPINYEYENDPANDYGHRPGSISEDYSTELVSAFNPLSSEWVQVSGPYATALDPITLPWVDLDIIDIDGTTKLLTDLQTTDGSGTAHWIKTDFTSMSTGWYHFRLRYEARGTIGLGGAITWYAARLSDYLETSLPVYWETDEPPAITSMSVAYDLNEKSRVTYELEHENELLCSIETGDLQWQEFSGVMEPVSGWTNASILSSSTVTGITSGPEGSPILHNDLWWDDSTTGDYTLVDEDTQYIMRLRVKDSDDNYSDWAYCSPFEINLLPRIVSLSAVQDPTDSTYVNITYTIVDKGDDDCTFAYQPALQAYYALASTPLDVNAMTLEGTVSGVTSSEAGTAHSGDLQWNVVADLGTGVSGTYRITLVPYDSYPSEVLGFGMSTTVAVDTGIPIEPPYDLTAVATTNYLDPFIRLDWKKGWEDTDVDGVWDDPAETLVEQYNIYRGIFGEALVLWRTGIADNIGDDDISYIDDTVVPGTRYCYQAEGIHGGQSIGFTNIDCDAVPTPPQEEDYALSNLAGAHLPKDPLMGVQILRYDEFIDIISPTDPGIVRQPKIELKLGHSVPTDAINLSAYNTNRLSKDTVVEIIDMSPAIIEDTDVTVRLQGEVLNPHKKYSNKSLLTNVFFFDGTYKDYNRMSTLVAEAAGGYINTEDLAYKELANRALFFRCQLLWEHSEAETEAMVPIDQTDLTKGYWYTGAGIELHGMPDGGKALIKLTAGTVGWTVTIYTNVIAQRFGVRAKYNQIAASSNAVNRASEQVVSISALRRKASTSDTEWYYDVVDGQVVLSDGAEDSLHFITESALPTFGVAGMPRGSIKLIDHQEMDDQWQIDVGVNKMTKSMALRELVFSDHKNSAIIPKNSRLSKVPINAVIQLIQTNNYSVDTEVQLHYDFTEYDEIMSAQSSAIDYGFVRAEMEQASIISPGSIRVKNKPLAAPEAGKEFITIYIFNTGVGGYTKYQLSSPGITTDPTATLITSWSADYQNGVINIPKQYTSYSVSDIIYIDYTYRSDYVQYDGFTDISGSEDIDWYVNINPRPGHGMTWEGFKEELNYVYGTDAAKWSFPGQMLYESTVDIYIQTDPTSSAAGQLTKIDSQYYTLDLIHGTVEFNVTSVNLIYGNILSVSSTVLADFVGRHVGAWKLLFSTMYVYALPNKITFHDLSGGIDIAFDLTDDRDSGTIRHTFDARPFDPDDPLYDGSKILIGRVHIALPVSMHNLSMIDTRKRGGNIDELNLHTWDKTPVEGKAISGNSALIVVVPAEVTTMVRSGIMTAEQVKRVAKRHAAAGTHIIVQYEDENVTS